MGLAIGLVILLIALAWLFWPSNAVGGVYRKGRPDVDELELERAERDVQEARDQDSVRDWGPGAGKAPL
jgi:hypothetical protein